MKFNDLDKRMRIFETAHDHCVLPGIYIVARIDGRNFTRLTKELHPFEAPFDTQFRDLMVATMQHVMQVGFRVVYGFTQSDEMSLMFHRDDTTFGRKVRKINSVLAGEASAAFSLELGAHAAFDCRVCQLPSEEHVVDYFRWRHEDAHRNGLNAHCYWALRREDLDAQAATTQLLGMSVADKNEMLFQRGVNYNDLPSWQKRGIGVSWQTTTKDAVNRKTGQPVQVERRELVTNCEVPQGDDYDAYVRKQVAAATA